MKSLFTFLLGLFALSVMAQKPLPSELSLVKEIKRINSPNQAFAPLRFLASDELMGRGTYRPEIQIAARYISEYFRALGLKEVPGIQDYFQSFSIKVVSPPNSGSLLVGPIGWELGKDLVKTNSGNNDLTGNIIYVGHGMPADLDKVDIKGKIVLSDFGTSDSSTTREGMAYFRTGAKEKMMKERGALASIERFKSSAQVAWANIPRYFSGEHPQTEESSDFGIYLIQDDSSDLKKMVTESSYTAKLTAKGGYIKNYPSKNVMAWVEGTDPVLKNQFIVLTAHYDHLGVAKTPRMEEGKLDSIYNGARDNAIGVTAVMDAAHYFSVHPPKRSVLFIAYSAEEVGEIGSKYFEEHPALPLKSLVYNLNIDNASVNDTTIVSVVGLGRTSADNDIKKGCMAFGLKAVPDSDPSQNLFDRSDNTNLAEKGIPAPTFSLGFSKFDQEIMKRYHQLSDEVGNLDLNYGYKYINAFILSARYIADNPQQPLWIKGDKYESAWKTLFAKP